MNFALGKSQALQTSRTKVDPGSRARAASSRLNGEWFHHYYHKVLLEPAAAPVTAVTFYGI